MVPFIGKPAFLALLLLITLQHEALGFGVKAPYPTTVSSLSPTQLDLMRGISRIFRGRKKDDTTFSDTLDKNPEEMLPQEPLEQVFIDTIPTEKCSVCIVGGGVSGMSAAITCAKGLSKNENAKVVLLEASSSLGGRVKSDVTDDGYTLDQGFAVFIEEYPLSKKLLDYDKLKLGKFLPGALIKIRKNRTELARVSDPLRDPSQLFDALFAPIGSIFDKLKIALVILNVRTKTIEELFQERETSTLDALKDRWGFSDVILDRFFKPFLEGIYLAPLEEQSSRMFSFVFKMFSEGLSALPEGGMGAVSQQLATNVETAGVDVRLDNPVVKIESQESGTFTVETKEGKRIETSSLIIATDGVIANTLISQIYGFESLEDLSVQVQRDVGCLYYGFKGEPPVKDPILILNGIGSERGSGENPVNNICFPSQVTKGYAPEGYSLCSVTVLKEAMEFYKGRNEDLDAAVRQELSTWFPNIKATIRDTRTWELKGIYRIQNAQPGQFKGPFPANVNGGRSSNTYRGKELPKGLFVCGDHMSTATLNGALESGVKAGSVAFKAVPQL